MNKAAAATRDTACEIRFGQVGLAQVRLRTIDATAVHDELAARLATAPQMFERTAVCLDLSALEKEPDASDLRAVLEAIRRAGMLPVGLAHGTATVDSLARALELPVLTQFRAQTQRCGAGCSEPKKTDSSPEPAEFASADLDASPTRAIGSARLCPASRSRRDERGRRGSGGDGGRVHTYIWGTSGSSRRRGTRRSHRAMFCQEFHAELISIAGVFRVFETIPPELVGKPVQAWLDGDDLRLARVGADARSSTSALRTCSPCREHAIWLTWPACSVAIGKLRYSQEFLH